MNLAKIRLVIGSQNTKGHIFNQVLLDPPGREDSDAARKRLNLRHQVWVIGWIASNFFLVNRVDFT
jgi:hypothetical protein